MDTFPFGQRSRNKGEASPQSNQTGSIPCRSRHHVLANTLIQTLAEPHLPTHIHKHTLTTPPPHHTSHIHSSTLKQITKHPHKRTHALSQAKAYHHQKPFARCIQPLLCPALPFTIQAVLPVAPTLKSHKPPHLPPSQSIQSTHITVQPQ